MLTLKFFPKSQAAFGFRHTPCPSASGRKGARPTLLARALGIHAMAVAICCYWAPCSLAWAKLSNQIRRSPPEGKVFTMNHSRPWKKMEKNSSCACTVLHDVHQCLAVASWQGWRTYGEKRKSGGPQLPQTHINCLHGTCCNMLCHN